MPYKDQRLEHGETMATLEDMRRVHSSRVSSSLLFKRRVSLFNSGAKKTNFLSTPGMSGWEINGQESI